jgi:parvulin-like peptidyl-prolyl isomerase
MKKILIFVMILFMATFAFAGKKSDEAKTQKKTDKIVAKVDGKPIYESEVKSVLYQFLRRSGMDPKSIDFNSPQLANYKKSIIDRLVERELLFNAASKVVKKDFSKEVNEQFSNMEKQFKSKEEFLKKIKESGTSPNEIKEKIKRNLIIREYIKSIDDKIKVTDKEVKEFYEKNPDAFKQEAQVRAAHILVQIKNSTDEEAKKKINDIYEKLKKGEAFDKLAKEYSDCPSKEHGGDLGYFKRNGQMVEEFSKVAFETPVGQYSKPFKTQFGYHIVKVLDKKPERKFTLDESKEKIRKMLKDRKLKENLDKKLKELKEKSKIEYL